VTSTVARYSEIDTAYQAQRIRLVAIVAAAVARALAENESRPRASLGVIVPTVEAGQRMTVALVDAYMASKAREAVGVGSTLGLDPSLYTIAALRGLPADQVYNRAFGALDALGRRSSDDQRAEAIRSARAAVEKLLRTDLQLAQTHSARDWMQANVAAGSDTERIVGYRRVLTGPGPHCELCTSASTRTYRVADLMPIHEHCGCTVEPLWGEHDVASVGTTVRVEIDPEIGPRLMAATWSAVGPRLS
jgi:hypothetical protein